MKSALLLLFLAPWILWGQSSACDLNASGEVDIADYQLLVNMALGQTPCTANINGEGVCNIVTAQRIVRAALGGVCTVDPPPAHSATLSWTHSVSANVTNYKVYRAETQGGPYVFLETIGYVSTYKDIRVAAGVTYYWVITALDSAGLESTYSNEATGTIPAP